MMRAQFIPPMSATLVAEPFSDPGWIFEVKWDGYRAIAVVGDGRADLYSRYGNLFNQKYPELIEDLEKLSGSLVLDGEVIVVGQDGKHSFELLQTYPKTKVGDIYYIVFDILYSNGRDIRNLPLTERKAILEKEIVDTQRIKKGEFIEHEGISFFEALKKNDFEGMVAKKKQSIYEAGKRSKAWQKIKILMEQEVVIGGFTRPKGSRKGFGALLAGVNENGRLVYVGSTGTGYNEVLLSELHDRLSKITRAESPFANPPKGEDITWVEPILVAEVKFREWTTEGRMRQSVFKGIREDKMPEEVTRELPSEVKDG